MTKTILVVGGAGYIGSHTSWLLHKKGYNVIILDSLLQKQIFNPSWAKLIKEGFADTEVLNKIFTTYDIDSVMHFAALIEVGESVKKPKEFYNNNVTKTLTLLDSMLEYNVKKIIFSSSCAVYGNPQTPTLDETHPLAPINPYGNNKLAIEFALKDYGNAYNLNYISLRYFNAAGSLFEQKLGEWHIPETHVIPLLLRAAMQNKEFLIFGDDYPTRDGSCIRDYIHVQDIAQAHILAHDYLDKYEKSDVFNLGSQQGHSVKELITEVEKICKTKINVKTQPRRAGDVPVLVANSTKAKNKLGWIANNSSLENILSSAHKWEIELKNSNYFKK